MNDRIDWVQDKIQIKSISYPNTIEDNGRMFYSVERGFDIMPVNKNGEMASVGWIQIQKEGKLVAEIKESVCDIYFI